MEKKTNKISIRLTPSQLEVISGKIYPKPLSLHLRDEILKNEHHSTPCIPCNEKTITKYIFLNIPDDVKRSISCKAKAQNTTFTEYIRIHYIDTLFRDA